MRLFNFASAFVTSVLLLNPTLALILPAKPILVRRSQTDARIEELEIRGLRRIPKETVTAQIRSLPGARYEPEAARRDLKAVVELGYFEPTSSRVLTTTGPRGGVVIIFELRERPTIGTINFRGLKSVSEQQVLSLFAAPPYAVSVYSPFNPPKVKAATSALKKLLADKGHPKATIALMVEDVSASIIALTFNVEEDPPAKQKSNSAQKT